MTYGSSLLKAVFPDVEGLHDTVLQQSATAAVTARGRKYVQVFHVNGNHWITASNINTACDNVVDIYDSSRVRFSSSDKAAIAKFHRCGDATLTLRYQDVQQQPNAYDCGVYALAFATSLLHGQEPTKTRYVDPRSHLASCLTSGQMLPFPHESGEVDARPPESLWRCTMCAAVWTTVASWLHAMTATSGIIRFALSETMWTCQTAIGSAKTACRMLQ